MSEWSRWQRLSLGLQRSRSKVLFEASERSQIIDGFMMFLSRGAPQLKFIEGNLNSEQYCEILLDVMIPFAESAYNGEWHFQQDNASMHVSNYTNEFFMENVVSVLDWPACSPDLNPIENLWNILVRAVYRDFRQFDTLEDLKEAIKNAWDNIDTSVLKKLADSLPRRCVAVITK